MTASTRNLQHDEGDPLDVEYAPGWTEQAGDKIRGRLVAPESWRNTDYGGYPIYTLELVDGSTARTKGGVTDGEVAVHARRSVLERKLANAKLEPGDEVGIKYQGPPLGTAVSHRYRVIKFLPDGSYVEIPYDTEPAAGTSSAERKATAALHRPLEDLAATQVALEEERDERDVALSE